MKPTKKKGAKKSPRVSHYQLRNGMLVKHDPSGQWGDHGFVILTSNPRYTGMGYVIDTDLNLLPSFGDTEFPWTGGAHGRGFDVVKKVPASLLKHPPVVKYMPFDKAPKAPSKAGKSQEYVRVKSGADSQATPAEVAKAHEMLDRIVKENKGIIFLLTDEGDSHTGWGYVRDINSRDKTRNVLEGLNIKPEDVLMATLFSGK